jgi:tetratricopeptide (TPR) repeat protein
MEDSGKTNADVMQAEPKKAPTKTKWYHKRGVRILAGVLAVILLLSALWYARLRTRYISLYSDIAQSNETLVELSRTNVEQEINTENIVDVGEYSSLIQEIKEGDNKNAIERAEKLKSKEQDPLMTATLMDVLAQLYYSEGRYQEAIDTATDVIDINLTPPASPYFVRGMGKMQLEQYDEASEDLKKSLELGNIDKAEVFFQLAVCSYTRKDYEETIDYAEKYIEHFKNSTATNQEQKDLDKEAFESNEDICRYMVALSYMNLMEFDKSKDYLNELINTKEDADLYYYRGVNNMALGENEAAISDFTKARELGKEGAELSYDLGICFILVGRISEGQDELWSVIDKGDNPDLATSATNILTALSQEN